MSEATRSFEEIMAEADRKAYTEQRLFVFSPLGAFPTALLIFVFLVGSYLLLAWTVHAPLLITQGGHVVIQQHLRTAFILALTLSLVLFIQRYTRVRERIDAAAFAQTLNPGGLDTHNLVSLTPRDARLLPATLVGLAAGLIASWLLYREVLVVPALFVWFTVVTTLLIMSFTRGVELTRTGARANKRAISEDLAVDLLRIDKLHVWGRSSARFALIWFTVGAVSCLFFLDVGLNLLTAGMIVIFVAIGIWVFLGTMSMVHRRIRAVKAAELDKVRGEIAGLREAAVTNTDAAQRMQGLLAYEARIAVAHEWPFDQTTAVRVAASALIVVLPWIGREALGYALDHMGRLGAVARARVKFPA